MANLIFNLIKNIDTLKIDNAPEIELKKEIIFFKELIKQKNKILCVTIRERKQKLK